MPHWPSSEHRLKGLTPADFAGQGPFFRIGHEPLGVDILTEIPGVEFDAAWQRRVEDVIDPASGLKAYFISAEDLITSKLGTGRPQDIADVDAIRKAAESQGPPGSMKQPPEPTSGPSQ